MKLNIMIGAAAMLAVMAVISPMTMHNKFGILQAQVTGLQKQIEDLETRLRIADNEVVQTREKAEARNTALTAECRDLRLANEELQGRLKTASLELAKTQAIESGIANLKQQQEEVRAKLEAMRSHLDATRLKTWR